MKPSLLWLPLLFGTVPALAQQRDASDRISVLRAVVVGADQAAGDVVCFGCGARVRGEAMGDIVAFGSNVEVEGVAHGDIAVLGGAIHLGSAAKVDGDAVAIGGYVTQDPGAHLGGQNFAAPYIFFPGQRRPVALGVMIVSATHLLLVLLCYAALHRSRTENIALALRKKPWRALLAGLGGWLIVSALGYLSSFMGATGEDIVDGLVFLAVAVTLLVGLTGISAWLGERIAHGATPLRAILAGSILILVLEVIPLLGFLILMALAILALGSAIVSGLGVLSAAGEP